MAFSDPQSVTINSVALSLPRTSAGENKSTYTSADGMTRLTASSAYGKRIRRVLRLDIDNTVPDPYGSTNTKQSMSNYIVFDVPLFGWSHDEILENWRGLKTLAAASSDSIVSKLLGGEN